MLSMEEILKKEVVYKTPNMDKVKIVKDLLYKNSDNRESSMDLYIPIGGEEKLPLVILVHGEAKGINFKEIGQYKSIGKLIASSGINAAMFNHKMLSDGFTIEEVMQDIDEFIDYLLENDEKLNIDKQRLAIWCVSGGVPFGLYAGMHSFSSFVKCIIAYYGFGDFKNVGKVLETNISDIEAEKYSPVNLINENSKVMQPLFIARAGLDNPLINKSIDGFITKALANNLNIDIYNHPEGVHSFDLFNDNNRSKEIIAKSLEFLKENLI